MASWAMAGPSATCLSCGRSCPCTLLPRCKLSSAPTCVPCAVRHVAPHVCGGRASGGARLFPFFVGRGAGRPGWFSTMLSMLSVLWRMPPSGVLCWLLDVQPRQWTSEFSLSAHASAHGWVPGCRGGPCPRSAREGKGGQTRRARRGTQKRDKGENYETDKARDNKGGQGKGKEDGHGRGQERAGKWSEKNGAEHQGKKGRGRKRRR